VRLVFEHEHEYPSQWKAICSIAEKSDLNRETLRQWVRQAERDNGRRPGLTTDERQRMHDLEREVKELRRANEILKAASAFFARELDPRPPR
jgi:transposase